MLEDDLEEVTYLHKQTIYTENDPVNYLYFIKEG